jgi:hypothetical protein
VSIYVEFKGTPLQTNLSVEFKRTHLHTNVSVEFKDKLFE